MINPTDITNRLLDHANTAAAWGDTTTADTMNEAATAIITLDAELTKVKAAWEVEATANLDLVKRIEALERKLGYYEAHTVYNG